MSTQNGQIEQLKQDISKEYLKKYKGELWWLKSLALYPIEKDVKNILSGKVNLPENFDEIQEFGWWGRVLNFLSKGMAEDLLNFMKEKRLEIERRKTESELLTLKNEVLGIQTTIPSSITDEVTENEDIIWEDENNVSGISEIYPDQENVVDAPWTDSVIEEQNHQEERINSYVAASPAVWLAGAGYVSRIRWNTVDKAAARGVWAEKMQELWWLTLDKIRAVKEEFEKSGELAMKNPRLTGAQKKQIQKAIDRFGKELQWVGENEVKLFEAYAKFWDKIPLKVLKQIEHLDPKILKQIGGLDSEVLKSLVGKNAEQVTEILWKNIKGLSETTLKDLWRAFSGLKKVEDVKDVAHLLSHARNAKKIFNIARTSLILDFVFLGVDIWMFVETLDESKLIAKVNEIRAKNKKNQAWTEFGIGIASFAAFAIIGYCVAFGSLAGPWGLVAGLAVGVVTATVFQWVNSLYFDVQDFYKQNREDFIRQPREKLIQAILQNIHNKKEGNVSLNEKLWSPDQTMKDMTLKDAWESIFFLEEIDKNMADYPVLLQYQISGKSEKDFLDSVTVEMRKDFEEQKTKLNGRIALRTEYVQKSLGEEKTVVALKSGSGMHYLSQLLSYSEFYADKKDQKKRQEGKNIEENIAEAKKELLKDIPDDIVKRLSVLDKNLLYEIYYGAKVLRNVEGSVVKLNADYVIAYIDAMSLGVSREESYLIHFSDYSIHYGYVEEVLKNDFKLQNVEYPNFSNDEVKNIAYKGRERKNNFYTSSSVSQNIIYRLAKEFYGYTWNNDAMELMKHFSTSEDNVHGLYYKDGWYINDDRAIDEKFDLTYLDDKQLSDKEVSAQTDKIIKRLVYRFNSSSYYYTSVYGTEFDENAGYDVRKESIDTPTEAVDKYLNDEFETRFRQIIQEELSFRTTEKKQDIKNQIYEFVKNFSKEDWYVEIPYYLVISAKRAGLGDLEKVQFSYRNGKIVAVGQVHDLRAIGDLEVEKEYIERARDKFTPEEMQYINLVGSAREKVEDLKKVQGSRWIFWTGFEGDLDIPTEISVDISQHSKDWNTFKGRLLCYDPATAQNKLLYEYNDYYEYFTSIYRWILLKLNTFRCTNDVDTMGYFQDAVRRWNQEFFDEKWFLQKNIEGKLNIEWKGVEEFYNKQIEDQTYNGKTVKELWVSSDEQERRVGQRYSTHIITAMLEAYLVNWNDEGIAESFRHSWNGATKGKMHLSLNDENFIKKFSDRLSDRLEKNPFSLPDLVVPERYKQQDELQIRSYLKRDRESEQLSKKIQKNIEWAKKNVERQGKRGDIKYNPEDSTLESRWRKIKVEFEWDDKIKIPWFTRALDIQSWLWLSNFINWYRFTYPNKQCTYESTRKKLRNKRLIVEGTVIISNDTLKGNISGITDGEIEMIATLLNSQ